MANSIFLSQNGFASDASGNASTPGTVTAGGAGGSFYAADGTALLPAYSFTSEPTLGVWRSAAGTVTVQGGLNVSAALSVTGSVLFGAGMSVGAATNIIWSGRSVINSPLNGQSIFRDNGNTAGVGLDYLTDGTFKVLTRAMGDTAIVNASRFSSGANQGVVTFGPGAVTSITVKGGLVVAIS